MQKICTDFYSECYGKCIKHQKCHKESQRSAKTNNNTHSLAYLWAVTGRFETQNFHLRVKTRKSAYKCVCICATWTNHREEESKITWKKKRWKRKVSAVLFIRNAKRINLNSNCWQQTTAHRRAAAQWPIERPSGNKH